MPTITVQDICKNYNANHYTVKAVDHIDISFSGNEAVAIVGPSGSGKSTLLNMIGLILRPDSGSIQIDGQETMTLNDEKKSALRNRIFGYVMQDFSLLDDETVYSNILLPLLYNKDISRREHKTRIHLTAERLGISDKLRRKAAKLSGGERQRVAIARAIVCDQPIILADEPTGSLDAHNKENVMQILMKLCKEQNKMLIIVTHDMSIAKQCDRVIHIKNGRIVTEE